MRYCHLYEEGLKEEGGEGHHQEQDLLINLDHDVLGNNKKRKKKKNDNNNIVYRYDWLVNDDVETIQNKIIDFVIDRKKEGLLGAKGIDNYINPLEKFYKVNGIKGIDWELIRSYKPDDVKKTQDREYYPEEVIAIEEKLDVRGKVVSGVMRGSGIRRGAEPLIKVGDLIPIQTKRYGKIYKIIVDRGTPDMYTTACIPEIAKRIDDYFEYRIRFGEVCKLYEKKSDHKHEYHDGDQWFEISYKADDKHLDPDAPS